MEYPCTFFLKLWDFRGPLGFIGRNVFLVMWNRRLLQILKNVKYIMFRIFFLLLSQQYWFCVLMREFWHETRARNKLVNTFGKKQNPFKYKFNGKVHFKRILRQNNFAK